MFVMKGLIYSRIEVNMCTGVLYKYPCFVLWQWKVLFVRTVSHLNLPDFLTNIQIVNLGCTKQEPTS